MSNNAPHAVVELTEEQYTFLLHNIDSNLVLGLELMQGTQDRSTAEKLVKLNEDFKSLRDAVMKGKL